MFKKAGTIIGIVLVLLAVGLNWFFNREPSSDDVDVGKSQQQVQQEVKQVAQPTQQVVQQPVQSQQQQTQQVVKQPVQQEPVASPTATNAVQGVEVDMATLGAPVRTETEIVVIKKKRVLLLTDNVSGGNKNQLVYNLELLLSDNSVYTHYVSATTFESFAVNERLKLTYDEYTNDNGVVFKAIKSVEVLQ